MVNDASETGEDVAITEDMLYREQIPPEDIFSVLQNEVRLAVLRVLWAAEDDPVSYTELERRSTVDTNNFNYHVDQLVGHFVRRTEDGYELRQAGTAVLRVVIAGSMTDHVTLGPIEIAARCPYCGFAIEIQYADGLFTARCTDCAGVTREKNSPRGTILRYAFPPAGVVDRTPAELLEAAHVLYDAKITPMLNGVCPECAATVDHSLDVCDEHRLADDGVCETCNGRFRVWTTHECCRCGYTRQFVPWFKLLSEPAVISFYYEQTDIVRPIPFNKLSFRNAPDVRSINQSVVSTDPIRIQVEIPLESAVLRATIDENLELVDIERGALDD
jgi:hypothetical protein